MFSIGRVKSVLLMQEVSSLTAAANELILEDTLPHEKGFIDNSFAEFSF